MSSLKDLASLIMIPSLVKDGRLDTVKPLGNSIIHPDATGNNDGTDGSTPPEGNFTFSRGSNLAATRVDVNGLIEKGRENLLLQSNQFDTTPWINAGTNDTGNQAGYDGSNNAWLITKVSANGRMEQSVSSSGVNTLSVYAKPNASDWALIQHIGGGNPYAFFNIATGEKGAIGGGAIDSKIESVGNGWYRLSISSNVTITQIRIYPAETNTTGATSGSIYIQDAQLEKSMVATDYIETGASTAQAGILEDLPRLDYSGGASCPALLLEPSRTNIISQSEYFGDWSLSRTSAFGSGSALNDTTSPEGVVNAAYIQQASGETDGGGVFNGYSYTSGTTYTLSVFAKKGENRYARIGFGIGGGGAGLFCGFDLQEGVAGTPNTGITPSIEPLANGWYRCSITATAQFTGVRNTFVYQSSNLNDFVTTPLQGIYIYGAQLEDASYPTSYIPTYGSAVTRSVDSCVASSLTTSTDFTIFFEAPNFCLINGSTGGSYDNVQFVFSENGGPYVTNGSYHIYNNTLYYYNGSTAQGFGVIYNNQTDSKFVIMKRGDKVLIFANGAKKTEATLPSGGNVSIWDTINLTQSLEDGQKDVFGSTYKQLLKFDTALTDSECIALTTI
jgi:hypothetical protein